MKYAYALIAALMFSTGSIATELPPTSVDEIQTLYRCYRDPGFLHPVCVRVPIQQGSISYTIELSERELAEQAAASQAALFALPIAVPLDPDAPTQLCHPTTHGASGCCRIVTYIDGDPIVLCGQRTEIPVELPISWLSNDPTTEACSTVHGAGSCCRIVISDPINGEATPIERVVCGNR